MTVTAWVDLGSKEVDVTVTAEDIRASIDESFRRATQDTLGEPISKWDLYRALNNMAAFLDALTVAHLETLSSSARRTVAACLKQHAGRFEEVEIG
jgi:hypothetical protein